MVNCYSNYNCLCNGIWNLFSSGLKMKIKDVKVGMKLRLIDKKYKYEDGVYSFNIGEIGTITEKYNNNYYTGKMVGGKGFGIDENTEHCWEFVPQTLKELIE